MKTLPVESGAICALLPETSSSAIQDGLLNMVCSREKLQCSQEVNPESGANNTDGLGLPKGGNGKSSVCFMHRRRHRS